MSKIRDNILQLTSSRKNTIKLATPIIHTNASDMSAYDNEIIELLQPKLIITDENKAHFWISMSRLNIAWCDIGENGGSSEYNIRRAIANIDHTRCLFIYLREFVNALIDDLEEKLVKAKVEKFISLDGSERKKVLSHIIGKGKNVYDNVCAEYSLISYFISLKLYRDFRNVFISNNMY